MATYRHNIDDFRGIDQSRSENRLNSGYSPDAQNMDTDNGDLAVGKGFVKHIPLAVPGSGPIHRMYLWRRYGTALFIVAAGDSIYVYRPAADGEAAHWESIHTYPASVDSDSWDFEQVRIGPEDHLIIANGQTGMIKWSGTGPAAPFGSGEFVYEGAVVSTAPEEEEGAPADPEGEGEGAPPEPVVMIRTVVIAPALSAAWFQRAKDIGVSIGGKVYAISAVSDDGLTLTLAEPTADEMAEGAAVKVRGGLSDKAVNFIEIHYSRLFAAGDPEHPSRLYWSQPPGDVRTIEDWSMDEILEDTGGGHVEVGNTSSDPITGLCALPNQLLIFKASSIYRMLGDRPSNFRIQTVNMDVERMANTARVSHGDVPYWLTRAGMYYHNGQQALLSSAARQVRYLLQDADLDRCKAVECRDRLYFTCRRGAGGVDDSIIVYDFANRTYMLRNGFTVIDLCASDGTMYMINGSRIVYRFGEGRTYDGAPISAYWRTPLTDLSAKTKKKKLRKIIFRGEGGTILFDASLDGKNRRLETRMPETETEIRELTVGKEGRAFSIRISNQAGSYFRLTGGIELEFDAWEE